MNGIFNLIRCDIKFYMDGYDDDSILSSFQHISFNKLFVHSMCIFRVSTCPNGLQLHPTLSKE